MPFQDNICSRYVSLDTVRLHLAMAGKGELLLFVHGFPENCYSWRHQLSYFAQQGYCAVAMDVRGYGLSDKPYAVEAYSLKNLTDDVVGVIQALGYHTAVLVGHDWGAPIVWNTAWRYPHMISKVIGVSVPYSPMPKISMIDLMKQKFGDDFFYQLYFQKEGIAERELSMDTVRSLRLLYTNLDHRGMSALKAAPTKKSKGQGFLDGMIDFDTLPAWLTQEDIAYHALALEREGWRGALNRYRNFDRDLAELGDTQVMKIAQPAGFMTGCMDLVNFFTGPGYKDNEALKMAIGPHYDQLIDTCLVADAGHWVQQEQPIVVNNFINKIISAS